MHGSTKYMEIIWKIPIYMELVFLTEIKIFS